MKCILYILFLLCFASTGYAACTGTTPNYTSTLDSTSIQTCFNNASHTGDTITLVSGTGHLTTYVDWTAPANATLIGAGTSVVGGGDQTILIDDDGNNEAKFRITTNATGTFRMTGITIKGGTGALADQGIIKISGFGIQTRIDHIHWDGTTYTVSNGGKWMQVTGGVYGVLDHSILDLQDLSWTHFTNSSDFHGDANWAAATGFGTANFFYIEDNIINNHSSGSAYSGALTDCHTGGRYVARFNTLLTEGLGQTHPTGHGADDRGCRAHELYGNLITSPLAKDPNFAMEYNNSGPAIVWNNQALQVFKIIHYFNDCRVANSPEDDWCGYTMLATPTGWGNCGTRHGPSNWDRNDDSSGRACVDQPGRGQGDLLTGDFPSKINSTTGTIHWPNQALEPIYFWMENASIVAGWGGSYLNNYQPSLIVSEKDYYEQASGIQTSKGVPFDGTTGTGWGTLARRPDTCSHGSEAGGGVGYFATDQGSWNTSGSNSHGVQMSGASGILYKCTATDTWTVYYTPYTYPHPLIGGGSSLPSHFFFGPHLIFWLIFFLLAGVNSYSKAKISKSVKEPVYVAKRDATQFIAEITIS